MSIRSEAMSYRGTMSFHLQDLLRRNGMHAQLAVEGDRYLLLVQGHDSPLLSYPVSEQQFRALCEGGTNYANKRAYTTFNGIVGRDFDLPSSYVAARNVNGRVVMGLHGVRESIPESHLWMRPHAFGPGFLGWAPRQQAGMHLRRIGGVGVLANPMMIEHTDGRMRPGELKSGGYGYYYKGQTQGERSLQQSVIDPLKDIQAYFPPAVTPSRPTGPVQSYSDAIGSDVYFSNERWKEVLAAHGIVIDEGRKTLTIQSSATQQDFVYDLSDVELMRLTENSLKKASLQDRIDLINNAISIDFQEGISMEMLEKTVPVSIRLNPEVERSLSGWQTQCDTVRMIVQDGDARTATYDDVSAPDLARGYVDGSGMDGLNERKGWYREGAHGREVSVGGIWVEQIPYALMTEHDTEQPRERGKGGEKVTYQMSAVINGEIITHEISRREYEKFMAVDDYHRQRMMSKIFKEVDLKTRPELQHRFNPLAALAAGLEITREATYLGADIAHNIEHIKHPHPVPDLYEEVHGTGRIYVKPGVDSPQDIASRAFEAGVNHATYGHGMGR